VVLQRLAGAARGELAKTRLRRIEEYDRGHSSHYLETLRIHLSSFGDPTRASALLGIHTNTLRYRLGRIRDLFGIDVGLEDERLALLIEFRLAELNHI